jgi:membrane protease YdiL (CAAX protease family)
MREAIDWKIFAVLFAAGLLGVVAVLPYVFDLLGAVPAFQTQTAEMPLPLVVGLALLQNGILLAAAIVFGMILSRRVGLGMPLIRAWATREPLPNATPIVRAGLLVGAAAGAVLIATDAIFFLQHVPAGKALFEIPLWKRLAAGVVYGGITEELLMRLFLMSLAAWLIGKWWKAADGMPAPGAFWAAIIVVALVFGLGHLPVTSVLAPLTSTLVLRALLLNGIAGVAFGYLYWRHGLEAAMLGHMSAHLVMQGPGTALLTRML